MSLILIGLGVVPVGSAEAASVMSHATRQSRIEGSVGHGASPKGAPPHAPGYLGILFQDLTDEQVTALRLKSGRGVEVMMVDHDGPAGKAGLLPHDVIVSLNGQMIASAEMLHRMIHEAGVGASVALAVVRGGRQVVVNAQLAYRGNVEKEAMARMEVPDEPEGEDVVQGGTSASGRASAFLSQMLHNTPFTGLVMEAMEPQLAGYFGVSGGGGLLVETVAPNSPGSMAGLRAGDVVLRVDSIGVRSMGEWAKRLHASKGQAMVLTVLRDKHEQQMSLIPEGKRHSQVEWPGLSGRTVRAGLTS